MFGKYMDYKEKNDMVGAFMFFVTHLILVAGISTVLVHFMGMAGMGESGGSFFGGGNTQTMIGSLFVLWLGGSILAARNATSDMMSVIVVMGGIYLAWTASVMLGLVPIALLTTMSKSK